MAIALATGSFVLLTGAVETTRLQVRGTVESNFRSSYDLLVRPASSYASSEREQGLVRPNYQSGIFGGITQDQVSAIRATPGVEVAAPVANIGYVSLQGAVVVSLRRYLNRDAQQLFRIWPTWTMDRGTSRFLGAPLYVYVSRNTTTVLERVPNTRGVLDFQDQPAFAEVVPGRKNPVPVCTNYSIDKSATAAETDRGDTPFGYRDPYAASGPAMWCYYTTTTPSNSIDGPSGAGDPSSIETAIPVSLPVLLTAVDPGAESSLSGLDQAVVSGRALSGDDTVTEGAQGNPVMPVLAADKTDVDQQVSATIERVTPPRGRLLSDAMTGQEGVVAAVARLSSTVVGQVEPVGADASYAEAIRQPSFVQNYWTVGPSNYRDGPGKALEVQPVKNPESVYRSAEDAIPVPVGSDDRAVREVTGQPIKPNQRDYPLLGVVGEYDPTKVRLNAKLSGLSSETYASPLLPGADEVSRDVLGDQPLAPSTNLGGYPAQPPTLLTTLAGAAPLLDSKRYRGADPTAPISVVRVRVTGVTGVDPVSRERLNQVALAVAQQTMLAVDIVAGASGVPTTVVLPAGEHGRPELRLREDWARKGVAYDLVDAVDRKSLALFILILAVCALVVGNAASAAVRTRRIELGVLSCLGWGARRLFGVVQAELILIGLAAGVVGTGLAAGASALLGLPASLSRAALAVPAAMLLASLAGVSPAVRAARAAPMDAVRPQVTAPRRPVAVRSVAGFAVQGLRRIPGRTALGAVSLAVAVGAATFLIAVQQVFRNVVVGSLLGDAVTIQVRVPDLLALVAIATLGAAGVADVLYLAAHEQAAELAVLRATGWSDRAVFQIVLVQGAAIGTLGGLGGATAGCAALARLVGALPIGLVVIAILCALAGVLVGIVAALVPAVLLRRAPIIMLLAEEN